jgi:hypothetical protein
MSVRPAIAVAAILAALAMASADAACADEARLPHPRPAVSSEAQTPVEGESPFPSYAEAPRLPQPRPARVAVAAPEPPPADAAPPPLAASELPPVKQTRTATAAIDALMRLPRARPPRSAALALLETGPVEDDEAPSVSGPPPPLAQPRDESACLERLETLGVQFTRQAPIDPGGACPVAAPLAVASLGSGVALAPEAILNCRTAEALARWVKESLVPQSRAMLGRPPDRITHASTYVCRARNNVAGAKLSEHAHANAVDIAAIGFSGRKPVDIGKAAPGSSEGRFETAIRKASCAYFTTVLGPGSNAAHATHFHFDMAERRGGYRLCDLGEPRVAGAPPKTRRE